MFSILDGVHGGKWMAGWMDDGVCSLELSSDSVCSPIAWPGNVGNLSPRRPPRV